MAVISLDIGTNANRIANAFAVAYGYQDNVPDPANPGAMIPNPDTKAVFTKKKIADFIRNTVIAVEAEKAASDARAATSQAVTDSVVVQ